MPAILAVVLHRIRTTPISLGGRSDGRPLGLEALPHEP